MRFSRDERSSRPGETWPLWRRGRAYGRRWRAEWLVAHHHRDLSLELKASVSDESKLVLHLAIPWLLTVWLTRETPRAWLAPWMLDERIFGVRFNWGGALVMLLIARDDWAVDTGMSDYYRRQTPPKYTPTQLWPGWEWSISLYNTADKILGPVRYAKDVLETWPVAIPMDGTTYPATVQLTRQTWQRSRLPWKRTRYSTRIEVPKPPMFAGKGENGWDCDDDGIFGCGSEELTAAGCVADYVKRVLQERARRGPATGRRASPEPDDGANQAVAAAH